LGVLILLGQFDRECAPSPKNVRDHGLMTRVQMLDQDHRKREVRWQPVK
jgi:hypothetical protein